MDKQRKYYLQNVLTVLQRINKLFHYSLEKNQIEYRILLAKRDDIDSNEEWRIVRQLSQKGIVIEYDESEAYERKAGNTILEPSIIFFLKIDKKIINNYFETIANELNNIDIDDSSPVIWSSNYKWASDVAYQAKKDIVFSGNKSARISVFRSLVNAKGFWVKTSKLIDLNKKLKLSNIRTHISQLNNRKLVGTGIKIESRNDPNKQSMYRAIIKP